MSFCMEGQKRQSSYSLLNSTENLSELNSINDSFKKTLKINSKTVKLSHGETIAVYTFGKSFKAEILFNNQVIKTDISVSFIGKALNFSLSGNLNGLGIGAILCNEKNKLYIGEVKGLKGGALNYTENEDYKSLIKLIKDNENPHVSEDLKKLFSTMIIQNSQIAYIENQNLPRDILFSFYELIEFINKPCNFTQIELDKLKNQLTEIVHSINYWEFLNLLLELYCIRKLSVKENKSIIKSFKQKNPDEKDILELFENYGILDDDIMNDPKIREEELGNKYKSILNEDDTLSEWPISTWVIQVLTDKMKTNHSFFKLLDKDENYFINKFFTLKDPISKKTIIDDPILSYQRKNECNFEVIISESRSLNIQITEDQVNIISKLYKEQGISKRLNVNSFSSDITKSKEIIISDSSHYITPGKYYIKRLKDMDKEKAKTFLINDYNYILKIFLIENDDSQYLFKIYNKKNSFEILRVTIKERHKKIVQFFTLEDMDKSIKEIISENCNLTGKKYEYFNCITVDNNEDTNRRRVQQLNLIKKHCETLRIKLIKNQEKRIEILRNYIELGMTNISSEQTNHFDFNKFLIIKYSIIKLLKRVLN